MGYVGWGTPAVLAAGNSNLPSCSLIPKSTGQTLDLSTPWVTLPPSPTGALSAWPAGVGVVVPSLLQVVCAQGRAAPWESYPGLVQCAPHLEPCMSPLPPGFGAIGTKESTLSEANSTHPATLILLLIP